VLLFVVLFTFDKSTLKKVQAFVLETLDVILSSGPLSDLLVFHQFAAEGKAGFVGCGWQRILKGSLLTHLLNELHFCHASRQAFAIEEVFNLEDFQVSIILINHILWREGVSLGLGLSKQMNIVVSNTTEYL